MRQKAETLIREVLQPLVEADGGHLELLSIEKNAIVLRLTGTCEGCPGRPYTTHAVIEPLLREALGEAISIQYDEIGPLDRS